MPQPLRGKHSGAVFNPNPIKDRPEAAAAMANSLAAWNLFEWDLVDAYSVAMGFYLPGIQGWEPANHPLAFQIFDALSGLNPRLELLERCVAFVAPDLAPSFTAMRPTIRRMAGKRAEIAHGKWGINDRFPSDLILCPTYGPMTRWTVGDFDTRATEFFELRKAFTPLNLKLRNVAKARPGLRPPPV